MARDELTSSEPTAVRLGPDARVVLDRYLDALSALLSGPAGFRKEILAEIEDGLIEATTDAVAAGAEPAAAAQAAVEDCGDPQEVAAAYAPEVSATNARRVALTLLLSGPAVGVLWLAAVAPDAFPPWDHAIAALDAAFSLIGPALVVGVPAAILAVAATGQLSRWLSARSSVPSASATLAAGAAGIADISLLIGYAVRVTAGSGFHQIALLAVLASLTRLAVAARAFHRCLNTFSMP